MHGPLESHTAPSRRVTDWIARCYTSLKDFCTSQCKFGLRRVWKLDAGLGLRMVLFTVDIRRVEEWRGLESGAGEEWKV